MKKVISTIVLTALIAVFSFGQSSVMDFYNAKTKEGQKGEERFRYKLNILNKNVSNGYIQYDYSPPRGYLAGAVSSPEQMAYFTAHNGQKFVVTAIATEMGGEGIALSGVMDLQCYELQNGQLVLKTDKYFSSSLKKQIQTAIVEGRAKYAGKGAYITLPEYGTTIKIGVWAATQSGFTKVDIAELRYNVSNATFSFVKK